MSSPDDVREGNISRRRFIKWAGAVVAFGAVGTRLGPITSLLGQDTNPTPPAAPPGTKNDFSIFWITDTQFLSESNPALFKRLTNWIVNNWRTYNGKMVVHTGDIVQTGARQVEWENANEAMSTLLKNGIPYTWCAGNHDDRVGGDPTSGWNGSIWAPALNPSLVRSQVNGLRYARWAGDYHHGMNTAISFSADDLNFLVINIEWKAGPDVLEWVKGLLDDPAYANHSVIIAPHAYIDAWGQTHDPRWGSQLATFVNGLTALMDEHSSNVFLTLNGHFATDCGYNTPSPINNRNELMFDRQDCTDDPNAPTGRGVDVTASSTNDADKVGGATVTILTFGIGNNQISVRTYDVYTGKWRDEPFEQYTIAMFSTSPPRNNNSSVISPVLTSIQP